MVGKLLLWSPTLAWVALPPDCCPTVEKSSDHRFIKPCLLAGTRRERMDLMVIEAWVLQRYLTEWKRGAGQTLLL
jgi:hypothetical protein